jgi:hypothetical protein
MIKIIHDNRDNRIIPLEFSVLFLGSAASAHQPFAAANPPSL